MSCPMPSPTCHTCYSHALFIGAGVGHEVVGGRQEAGRQEAGGQEGRKAGGQVGVRLTQCIMTKMR